MKVLKEVINAMKYRKKHKVVIINTPYGSHIIDGKLIKKKEVQE